MSDDALFGMDPTPLPSPGQSLTRRQAAAIAARSHPLSLPLGTHLPLHPDAVADPDERVGGPRCGGCAFASSLDYHNRRYLKCLAAVPNGGPAPGPSRLSHGTATDLRRWWPACRDWQPRDGDDPPGAP